MDCQGATPIALLLFHGRHGHCHYLEFEIAPRQSHMERRWCALSESSNRKTRSLEEDERKCKPLYGEGTQAKCRRIMEELYQKIYNNLHDAVVDGTMKYPMDVVVPLSYYYYSPCKKKYTYGSTRTAGGRVVITQWMIGILAHYKIILYSADYVPDCIYLKFKVDVLMQNM
jgi:hypothetical protein